MVVWCMIMLLRINRRVDRWRETTHMFHRQLIVLSRLKKLVQNRKYL